MDDFELAKGLFFEGLSFLEEACFPQAEEKFRASLRLVPNRPSTLTNLSSALIGQKKFGEARALLEQLLAVCGDDTEAWQNLGILYSEESDFAKALACYERVLTIDSNDVKAHNNRGTALRALGQPEAALECYERALAIRPDYADAHLNRGNAFGDLRLPRAARESYERAIAIKPDYVEAYLSRGNVLRDLRQPQAALESYERALAIRPDCAMAHMNRGILFCALKDYPSAVRSYSQAFSLNPNLDYLSGELLHARMHICDWSSLSDDLSRIVENVRAGRKASLPFALLGLTADPALQKKAAEIYVADKCPRRSGLGAFPERDRRDRIRIAYYSADYHNHATMYLMAELFERHDKNRFELIGFSYGPDAADEMRRRAASAFDRFIEVRDRSDREVAQLSRDMGIDIAVDLKGYTEDNRSGIFAYGAAPVQVSYLGYPGTMGADYIDYLIADRTLITDARQSGYSEKIVYLPDSYQVNDPKRRIADKVFTREECGLPPKGFVFGCFNNNYKILPQTFDGWMRILGQVEGSVLWLFESNPISSANLRLAASRRGIDPGRLVFARPLPLAEHLARIRVADLVVDTLPYNAHTTTSDALWAGVPVLTCIGETFVSRVAASLLNAVGLPELITDSQEEYEAMAVRLAGSPDLLAQLKKKLAENRSTAALFDAQRFTKHIEEAYAVMYERHRSGLPPEHIYVDQ